MKNKKSGKRPRSISVVNVKCEYGYDDDVYAISSRFKIEYEGSGMSFDGGDMPRDFDFTLKQPADAKLLHKLLEEYFKSKNIKHVIKLDIN